MISLNVHQLSVFLAAAETLNFTQAARLLQVSQPSVSQHIQSLEEHFGLPLFSRTGRTVELTEAGNTLIPLARELLYLGKHLEESMASLKDGVHGHLIVGCSTSTGRYILPKLLAEFHERYPNVRATCTITNQEDALEMLLEGKLHLTMATDPPRFKDLEFQRLTTEETVLIVPASHPFASMSRVTAKELEKAQFILPEEGSDTYAAIREALAKAGCSIYRLETMISLGSPEAIALSVSEGLGIGFVPAVMVHRLVSKGVRIIKVPEISICQDIYVGRNTRRLSTLAQDGFWKMITEPNDEFWRTLVAPN